MPIVCSGRYCRRPNELRPGIHKRVHPHLLPHSDAVERLRQTGNPPAAPPRAQFNGDDHALPVDVDGGVCREDSAGRGIRSVNFRTSPCDARARLLPGRLDFARPTR